MSELPTDLRRNEGPSDGRRPATGLRPAAEVLDQRLLLASGVQFQFSVTNDWGSGFQAQVVLTNAQDQPVSNWSLAFDLPATVSSIWDAQVVQRTGNRYVVNGANWNKAIPARGSVTFGLVASPGGAAVRPSNVTLNGAPLDGSGGGGVVVPSVSIEDRAVVEGASGTVSAGFTVRLSQATTGTVRVGYRTADGTAQAGSDYQGVAGTLTFAPGETSKTIAVPVLGDTRVEPDETFQVQLHDPSGGTLGRATATGTITSDDAPPASGNIQYRVADNWGSGFTGEFTLKNPGATPLDAWTLEFDLPHQIDSIWNAAIVSHNGTRYVVQGASWNRSIAAGGTTSFGFTATTGGVLASPTNMVLRAGGASGGGGGTNQAPVAVKDTAYAAPGQAVTIAVLANDSDPNGDPMSVTGVTSPANGTAVIGAGGVVTYTPRAGFTGTDTFRYTVADGRGGSATGEVVVTVTAPTSIWPERSYAPYVDTTLYPTYDMVAAARNQGIRHFTMAFIVADPQKRPSWGGYAEYAVDGGAFDLALRSQVAGIRALGGDVMVSFGGAFNKELAEVHADEAQLKQAYRTVVDAYNLTHLDFDIEGGAVADRASVDRRSRVLAALQAEMAAAGRPLQIWLTLPVLPTGLTPDGVYVVQSARNHGLALAGVNIMTMDYGDGAAPNPVGRMGDYAIQAATSLHAQLRGVYGSSPTDAQLWQMVGVTPMIGLNDVQTEVFDQQEAREVAAFAKQKGIRRVSIWSLHRDRSNAAGAINYVEPFSSSIVQQPFEFSQIFKGYAS